MGKRLYRGSKGNKHLLQQSMGKSCSVVLPAPTSRTDGELLKLAEINCDGKLSSCVVDAFSSGGSTDIIKMLSSLRACSNRTRNLNTSESDKLLISLFKNSSQNLSKGVKRLKINWALEDGSKVCAQHFADAYGFSLYKLNACSRDLKENPLATSLSNEVYGESKLHRLSLGAA